MTTILPSAVPFSLRFSRDINKNAWVARSESMPVLLAIIAPITLFLLVYLPGSLVVITGAVLVVPHKEASQVLGICMLSFLVIHVFRWVQRANARHLLSVHDNGFVTVSILYITHDTTVSSGQIDSFWIEVGPIRVMPAEKSPVFWSGFGLWIVSRDGRRVLLCASETRSEINNYMSMYENPLAKFASTDVGALQCIGNVRIIWQ